MVAQVSVKEALLALVKVIYYLNILTLTGKLGGGFFNTCLYRTQSKCCSTWMLVGDGGGHQLERPPRRRKPVSCSEQCQREGKGHVLAFRSSLPAESMIKAHKAAHPKARCCLHLCV